MVVKVTMTVGAVFAGVGQEYWEVGQPYLTSAGARQSFVLSLSHIDYSKLPGVMGTEVVAWTMVVGGSKNWGLVAQGACRGTGVQVQAPRASVGHCHFGAA